MNKDRRGAMICRLVPGAQWTGCWYDDSVVWNDDRPIPSEEAIEAENVVYEEEKAQDLSAKAALKTHDDALNAGYVHTDGCTYHCDEAATTDMVKCLTLFGLDHEEPLPVIDMDGNIHMLSIGELQTLAKAIGQYQYGLRVDLWSALRG